LSLQKSGRGAKAAKSAKPAKPAKRGSAGKAASGKASGARQVYVQTAKNDVFTYLLAVSLGAILIGVIFLLLILNRYDWKTKVAGIQPASAATRMLS
jgi:hypothetical protein